jgi:glycosyltransferase involved in cell wall biosynthesis
LSNALLEAQSRGIPAVVSDIPGNRMVIEEGENGLIVPVADAKALARAILRLRADPALRARMGVRARERVRQRFSLETVTARLEEVYLGMLGR